MIMYLLNVLAAIALLLTTALMLVLFLDVGMEAWDNISDRIKEIRKYGKRNK